MGARLWVQVAWLSLKHTLPSSQFIWLAVSVLFLICPSLCPAVDLHLSDSV